MPWKSLKHALLFNAVGTALLGLLMIVDAGIIAACSAPTPAPSRR